MRTLDLWRDFLKPPRTIQFKELSLICRDFEPPILIGAGEVRSDDLFSFSFAFSGALPEPSELLSRLNQIKEQPYDHLRRLRLFGTDADGRPWALGWADTTANPGSGGWQVYGTLNGISPRINRDTDAISPDSSTEIAFSVPLTHPVAGMVIHAGQSDATADHYTKSIKVLDTEVLFDYSRKAQVLTATVAHSTIFRPPHAENWIAEPFRILFGSMIYPRLVARNFGSGNPLVFIRPAHTLRTSQAWGSLLVDHHVAFLEPEKSWQLYVQLLSLIASATDKDGNPNFEAHTVTRLYQEIAQSASGTRWVWALTLSSAIEYLVKQLKPVGTPDTSLDAAECAAFLEKVEALDGSDRVKGLARSALTAPPLVTVGSAFRELVKEGIVTEVQRKAWESLRHFVMHGNILSPYSEEKGDGRILALMTAMRAMTIAFLQRGVAGGVTT